MGCSSSNGKVEPQSKAEAQTNVKPQTKDKPEPEGNFYLKSNVVKVVLESFAEIDKDNSGKLTMDEIIPGMKKCGFEVDALQLKNMMDLIDDNNDGKLN